MKYFGGVRRVNEKPRCIPGKALIGVGCLEFFAGEAQRFQKKVITADAEVFVVECAGSGFFFVCRT